MDAAFLKQNELEDKILDIINHAEDFTQSDLQGVVSAVIIEAMNFRTNRRKEKLAEINREWMNKQKPLNPVPEIKINAVILWTSEDIQFLKPEWSLEQCQTWLTQNKKHIEERSTELGWEVIETLL